MKREAIIAEAAQLVETLQARGQTHGQGGSNFEVMSALLHACGYRRMVGAGIQQPLDALDAVLIYEISKIARIVCGDRYEPDHWIDTAGYAVIGGAIARDLRGGET